MLLALRIAAGAVVLTILQTASGMAEFSLIRMPLPKLTANPLPWQLADNILNVALLTWIAFRSRERGWRLAATLGVVFYGIVSFNSLIEAQFFGFFGLRENLTLLTGTLIECAIFAPLLVLLLQAALPSNAGDASEAVTARVTILRLLTGGLAYVVVYFAAGMLVLPYIKAFYATKPMPNPLALIALQVLIRGPVFVLLLYLAIRAARVHRAEAVLMAGTALSILGGVGLIVPNPFFPDAVRWAHFVEVTVSNFVFGAFVGWLLTRRARSRTLAHASAAA